MCARYCLPSQGVLEGLFGLDLGGLIEAGLYGGAIYNFAPSLKSPVLKESGLEVLTWGAMLGSGDKPYHLVNAKSETVRERFGYALKGGRCLIPAQGFFEWETVGKAKQPWFFQRQDESAFAFAGIEIGGRYAILTTVPNRLVGAVHDRMPCMIRKEDFELWLRGTEEDAVGLASMSFGEGEMKRHRVTPKMGNSRFEDPSVIVPFEDDQGSLF